jgi:type IV pilus assembly protein PilB
LRFEGRPDNSEASEGVMGRVRIGELLKQIVPLNDHDLDEILSEQEANGQRFGEVALSLGVCTPEHVWKAWCDQLTGELDTVDLEAVGVDAQVVVHVPADVAGEFRVIPVRASAEELVIATADPSYRQALTEVPRRLGRRVKFVLADAAQVERAIRTYYPPLQAAG